MGGFFTKEETQSKSRPDGKTYSCPSCGLYRDVLSPRIEPFGNFAKGIMNLGEAPGETEDRRAKPWQGKVGRKLHRAYKKLGIDLFEDCINVNSVNCRPPKNRAPTNYEIACCRKRVLRVIEDFQPKVIVLFGNSAIQSFLKPRWKNKLGGITKWRGWTIPDRDTEAWVCPTSHPSFVNRDKSDLAETIWMQDLERAVQMVSKPFPSWEDEKNYVDIITDLKVLQRLTPEPELVSIDYETTGLKPQAPRHRIVAAAVATGPDHCLAFLMPKSRKERKPFIDILANPRIGKMAHNIKFEETWSQVVLGQSVSNWKWDSMQAAHILDNRPEISGLKFQTFVRFGVSDYASEVASFLEGTEKSANSHNRILELLRQPGGKRKVLTYCGLDTIYEHKLALEQMKEMGICI